MLHFFSDRDLMLKSDDMFRISHLHCHKLMAISCCFGHVFLEFCLCKGDLLSLGYFAWRQNILLNQQTRKKYNFHGRVWNKIFKFLCLQKFTNNTFEYFTSNKPKNKLLVNSQIYIIYIRLSTVYNWSYNAHFLFFHFRIILIFKYDRGEK